MRMTAAVAAATGTMSLKSPTICRDQHDCEGTNEERGLNEANGRLSDESSMGRTSAGFCRRNPTTGQQLSFERNHEVFGKVKLLSNPILPFSPEENVILAPKALHSTSKVISITPNAPSVSSKKNLVTKKPLAADRIQRSRERNRIHARKTRQRKKEQMQNLQSRADDLKRLQVRLKQIINEKNTANILVGLFSNDTENDKSKEDPRVEELLRRPIEEIPDVSKLPELPALILPGQHASKKIKVLSTKSVQEASNNGEQDPNDGIDYELLGKDRSTCTPEELDQIRRERNRMHAKRTRDRKRLFMEEMAEMCRQLEEENEILRNHLRSIDPDHELAVPDQVTSSQSTPTLVSPNLAPCIPSKEVEEISSSPSTAPTKTVPQDPKNGVTFDQIKTLLEAAGSCEHSEKRPISAAAAAATISTDSSRSGEDSDEEPSCKRPRLSSSSPDVPQSFTTTSAPTPVGC